MRNAQSSTKCASKKMRKVALNAHNIGREGCPPAQGGELPAEEEEERKTEEEGLPDAVTLWSEWWSDVQGFSTLLFLKPSREEGRRHLCSKSATANPPPRVENPC